MNDKLKPINGWTKAKMLERIQQYVPNTSQGCVDPEGNCLYKYGRHRCGVGALMGDEIAERFKRSGASIRSIMYAHADVASKMPLDAHSLRELQRTHDNGSKMVTARQRCIDWVKTRVLSTPEDDEEEWQKSSRSKD